MHLASLTAWQAAQPEGLLGLWPRPALRAGHVHVKHVVILYVPI